MYSYEQIFGYLSVAVISPVKLRKPRQTERNKEIWNIFPSLTPLSRLSQSSALTTRWLPQLWQTNRNLDQPSGERAREYIAFPSGRGALLCCAMQLASDLGQITRYQGPCFCLQGSRVMVSLITCSRPLASANQVCLLLQSYGMQDLAEFCL